MIKLIDDITWIDLKRISKISNIDFMYADGYDIDTLNQKEMGLDNKQINLITLQNFRIDSYTYL